MPKILFMESEIKQPLLSILMPTIPSRKNVFNVLHSELINQREAIEGGCESVEILIDDSERFLEGGKSIGQKRDSLVQRASGKYLCFLDDDDWVFPNYLMELSNACLGGYDSYTFNLLYFCNFFTSIIEMSFENKENEQVKPDGIIKRTIWHICPILSSIAKTERFQSINYDEDWRWLKLIIPKIKTSVHLDMILHQYNDFSKSSEAIKIFKHGYK